MKYSICRPSIQYLYDNDAAYSKSQLYITPLVVRSKETMLKLAQQQHPSPLHPDTQQQQQQQQNKAEEQDELEKDPQPLAFSPGKDYLVLGDSLDAMLAVDIAIGVNAVRLGIMDAECSLFILPNDHANGNKSDSSQWQRAKASMIADYRFALLEDLSQGKCKDLRQLMLSMQNLSTNNSSSPLFILDAGNSDDEEPTVDVHNKSLWSKLKDISHKSFAEKEWTGSVVLAMKSQLYRLLVPSAEQLLQASQADPFNIDTQKNSSSAIVNSSRKHSNYSPSSAESALTQPNQLMGQRSKAFLARPQLWHDLDHVFSDMNACVVHLLAFMKAKWLAQSQLGNALFTDQLFFSLFEPLIEAVSDRGNLRDQHSTVDVADITDQSSTVDATDAIDTRDTSSTMDLKDTASTSAVTYLAHSIDTATLRTALNSLCDKITFGPIQAESLRNLFIQYHHLHCH